ncbi:Hint domain-containing protein [Pelagovum pacificum]|uniref:Hint domain-containing protein n=1 Tax=Pelagovum pacificum TaxID=2588711 RepID=A0A5C5GAV8_9RHOB|nr:Hint domain-containing protein [Pelagovum pacificum]QQA42089.1 Hint domain-containing protein [Pelagovum pacificum]TNY31177.1 Hint domain-containing protein [Pelagovum pacificum]
MGTALSGTFVISWTQTEINGIPAAPSRALRTGAAWRWSGDVVRVDGPNGVLPLGPSEGTTDLRRRAATGVRKLITAAIREPERVEETDAPDFAPSDDFTVSDGRDSWCVTLIDAGPGRTPLCMFYGDMPPKDTELWVVEQRARFTHDPQAPSRSVICFTPGTMIRTETGARPVETIREGERIQTRDNGCKPVMWIGSRRVTGARLQAIPDLAPVRLRAGSLGIEVPDAGLLVSPDHRLLVSGHAARTLYNEAEVLVRAIDLVNGASVTVERGLREVRYIHIGFDQHEVLFANSVMTESFHPASVGLDGLSAGDRARLLERLPGVEEDPMSYGAFARRMLSSSEAAILAGDAA